MFELNINGKLVKGFFGLHVFEALAEYAADGGYMSRFGFLAILITVGHENYCKMDRKPLPLVTEYREVREWLETNSYSDEVAESLVKILAIYEKSLPKRMIDKINESTAQVKKKSLKPTGKK